MTEVAKLKERAAEAFTKGKFAKAGELYETYCKASPKDLQSRLRMGDAWARAHQKERAIHAYQSAAEGFAKDGFLPRAIAASKLILELDPAHQGVQQMLADLYAQRGFGDASGRRSSARRAPAPVEKPAAPAIETAEEEGRQASLQPARTAQASPESAPSRPAAHRPGTIELGPPGEVVTASAGIKVHAIEIEPEVDAGARAQDIEIEVEPESTAGGQPQAIEIEVEPEPPAGAGDRAIEIEVAQDTPTEAKSQAIEIEVEPEAPTGPKVHTLELDADDDELSFADVTAEPSPRGVALEAEGSGSGGSISDSLESVSLDQVPIELDTPIRGRAAQLEPPVTPEPPVTSSAFATTAAPVASAPTAALGAPPRGSAAEHATPQPVNLADVAGTVALSLDDEPELPSGLLTTEAPRPVVPGPPPPPSRIISSGLSAPPGLKRKTEAEPAATRPSATRPPDRRSRSELRASLAAFSAFDELDPGFAPEPAPHSPPSAPEPDLPPVSISAPGLGPSSPAKVPDAKTASVAAGLAASASLGAEDDFSEAHPDAPPPVARPSWDQAGFTELELTSDSLLHAVELAAQQAEDLTASEQPEESEPESEDDTPDDGPAEGELPQIPLFSDLPHEAFIALFERSPLRRLGVGERIITQGSVGDAFYVICEGEVRVVREDDGQTRELARLTHGSFFGEMALLSGAPRTASVESTSEDTQLLEISAPVLAELSKDHPQIATALRKFCRQRMLSNVMESSALFRPFGKRDRRALIQRFRAREVRPGDLVIREGQRSDGLYVVLAGQVEVRKENRVLAQLKEGELFGEMSLLEKTPATATVCATKRTSLLRLPREDFDALILSHPQVLILVSELTEDRRKQNQALRAPPAPPVEGDEPLVLV